jgi:hypothetical protein
MNLKSMVRTTWMCAAIAGAALACAAGDGPHVSLNPATIGKPAVTSWPTFNGD